MIHTVTIDKKKCLGCGSCAKVCTKKILSLDNNKKIAILNLKDWGCCACGLCMAVCPAKAISVSGLCYDDFNKLPDTEIGYHDLENMLSSRRSIRSYSDRSIKKDTLEQIIHISAMSPIGSPPTNVKLRIVDKPDELHQLRLDVVQGWKNMIKSMKNPIFRTVLKKGAGAAKYNALTEHALPAAELYCQYADNGKDVFTFNAPDLMFFYGRKLSPCINENCWLSCSYALTAAHVLGLGATISGMLPPILNRNKEWKSRLGIAREEEIFACLMIGYPDKNIKFLRSIPRYLLEVSENGISRG